jgi:hypothetical protein
MRERCLKSARERKFIEKRRRGEGERNYESLCRNERKRKNDVGLFSIMPPVFFELG